MSARPETPTAEEIRDYLLRRMTEEARARFEEAYFRNDALLDRVEDEEDHLVSDYVLGKLTESDKHRFETALLDSPYYKDRVETTTRLHLQVRKHDTIRRRLSGAAGAPARFRAGAIAAALLLVLLAVAVASALRLRSERDEAVRRAESIALQTASQRPPAPGPTTTVVVLGSLPSGTGAEVRKVERTPGSGLLIVFPGPLLPRVDEPLQLVVADEEGGARWESPAVSREGTSDLSISVPSGVAASGRVRVTLRTSGAKTALYNGVLEISGSAR